MNRPEFIKKYSPAAISAAKGSAVLPEVILAASAVESNNGNSLLSSKYNNFFGVKADSKYKGRSVIFKTGEEEKGKKYTIKGRFRVYGSAQDSFRDYVKYLKTNPRYKKALQEKKPEGQIKEIAKAGYATAGNYAEILTSVVKKIKITPAKGAAGLGVLGLVTILILAKNGKR